MPFTFKREESTLLDPRGRILAHQAYSGHGEGLNNPSMEAVHGEGPIPAGQWSIGRPRAPVDHLGPLAMPLEPMPGTDAKGRTALFIHGDNASLNHTASDGCLILPRGVRQIIAESADRILFVE